MKTKAMKKGIILIATTLMIILCCLVSTGMMQEVRAEGINVNAVADARLGNTTVIWVQAELADGNRNYGDIILCMAVTPITETTYDIETIVNIQTKNYSLDRYVTEGYKFGYNISNATMPTEYSHTNTTSTGAVSKNSYTASDHYTNLGQSLRIDEASTNNNPMTMSEFTLTSSSSGVSTLELILTNLDVRGVFLAKDTYIADEKIFSIALSFNSSMSNPTAKIKYAPSVLRNVKVVDMASSPEYHGGATSGIYPNIVI